MDLLQSVDVLVLVLAGLGGLLIFAFLPARLRLRLGVWLIGPWLTLGMLQELGAPYQAAKMTEPLLFLWIAGAAALGPGARRGLGLGAWLYPLFGLAGAAFVVTATDWALAVALRAQWVVLGVAALLLARLATDRERLGEILLDLALGCSVGSLMAGSGLLFDASPFRAGLGRFFPYGSNPNHIGLLFAMSVPLCLWAATERRGLVRGWLVGSASLALGLALLTGSRSVLLALAALSVPLVVHFRRHPAVLVGTALISALGAALLYGSAAAEEADPSHLESVDTDRAQVAEYYLTHVIAERPLVGLLGTEGQSALMDSGAGTHPHNAYLELFYVGGLVYALPMLGLLGAAIGRAWRERQARDRRDLLLQRMILTSLAAVALHGFVNGAMYYPTYPWAFLHVLSVGLAGRRA